MIRDVILHMSGEQPLMADLFEPPAPGDVGVRCTNLRQMNGKRPVFIDEVGNIFFFPFLHIRFLEIPRGAMTDGDPTMGVMTDDEFDGRGRDLAPEPEPDLEIDEDLMRRIREV